MKNFSLSLVLLLVGTCSFGQTTISGTVKNVKGLAIPNVNIGLKNTYDGTSSDSTGRFSFTTSEKGAQLLTFSVLNFENDSASISLTGKTLIIDRVLKDVFNELEVVTVSAGLFVAGDQKKGAILSAIDVATTAGTRADVFAAMQTLPGAQTSFSESGLFVRGGSASETKTYFDGMLVKSPFNATVPDQASRGRLSAFLFKGTSFSAGGYSAQYGQALSSALILETTDLPEKTTTGISIMSVGLGIDQNVRFKNSALSVGGYYYNLGPMYSLIKQRNDYVKAPHQTGGNIQYKAKTSTTGIFKFYASYSGMDVSLNSNNITHPATPDYFSNNNNNIYINSTYKEFLNPKWKLETGVAYNKDSNEGMVTVNDYTRGDHILEGKITLTNFFGRLSSFKFGAETFNTGRKEHYNTLARDYNDQLSSAFAESDLFITNKLVIRLGLRAEYSSYLEQYNLAPRTSLGMKTGLNSQVSFAYGRFYQNPEDEYLILKPLSFEQADHYILKYEINTPVKNFRIEGYFKDYNKLTKLKSDTPDNTGDGYAKGFELFWRDKKSVRGADYWVSYSFLDSKRNFRDFPMTATPEFAAKHTLSVVYKQYFTALNSQIGGTYTFASGRTYVNPNNAVYLADKTKSYNNLSLTVSYLTHVLKQFSVIYLNVGNIAGFKNVYGYQYTPDGRARQAITPASRRDIFLGLMMTIGDNTFVR